MFINISNVSVECPRDLYYVGKTKLCKPRIYEHKYDIKRNDLQVISWEAFQCCRP